LRKSLILNIWMILLYHILVNKKQYRANQTAQGFELAVAENISCQTQSKPYVWQLMFSDNFRRRLSMVPAVWRD